jgi:serine/threonine protein kinase
VSRAGVVIDGCQLLKPVGEGPFGVVWLAKDLRGQKNIAVKLLKPHIVTQAHGRTTFARLQAALKAYSGLQHRNLAAMLRAVQAPEENAFGVASEFVEGQSLDRLQLQLSQTGSRVVDPKRLTRLLGWFEQVGAVLAWLHSKSVIHGNLKPTNLILVQGSNNSELKVLDLAWSSIGVAVPAAGAPSFLAPEQISGSPPTALSDQFSLIAMLHRYLTQSGRRLRIDDGVPPALIELVERAMKPVPQARYPSMLAVTDAIRAVRRALIEESTDKAIAVSQIRAAREDEPATMRMPKPELAPAPAQKAAKRSTSKPSARASSGDPIDVVEEFDGSSDFIASVAPEPSLDFGALHLPDEAELPPHIEEARRSSRTSPLMIAGAVLLLAAGAVFLFTETKLTTGKNATAAVEPPASDAAAETKRDDAPSKEAPPKKDEPAKKEETAKKDEIAKRDEAKKKTPDVEAARPHGNSPSSEDLKPIRAKSGEAEEPAKSDELLEKRRRGTVAPHPSKLDEKADQAMARLAAMEKGEGAERKDEDKPDTRSLEIACDEGDGPSCAKLGDMFKSGKGAARSDAKARSAFERACDFGRGDACHKAAEMWSEGQGGAQDPGRARTLEEAACRKGRKASCKSTKTSSTP